MQTKLLSARASDPPKARCQGTGGMGQRSRASWGCQQSWQTALAHGGLQRGYYLGDAPSGAPPALQQSRASHGITLGDGVHCKQIEILRSSPWCLEPQVTPTQDFVQFQYQPQNLQQPPHIHILFVPEISHLSLTSKPCSFPDPPL